MKKLLTTRRCRATDVSDCLKIELSRVPTQSQDPSCHAIRQRTISHDMYLHKFEQQEGYTHHVILMLGNRSARDDRDLQ